MPLPNVCKERTTTIYASTIFQKEKKHEFIYNLFTGIVIKN